ncbi:cytosine deaminase [Acetobacter conturbans]|uniref:Amidohydrolase family protein n=1 Tax=Acetobacter conturbans TaxID=1737472 RepID=A0ABX0K1P7_9PROT|nr:cytosine deaminase [Acetobacter conturbans]NHN88618.1 amidohydrolase family protein [Acetobacter conturbans]
MIDLLLKNAVLPDGRNADIAISDGRIAAIEEHFVGDARETLDIEGYLVSPPFVDSHFHLDTTLTAGMVRHNASGTLLEGIQIWKETKPLLTEEEIYTRARKLCEMTITQGTLAIRSHVDISDPDLKAVRALVRLREDLKPWMTIQLVAFPQDGFFRLAGAAEQLVRALDMGLDLVGGIPHYERTTLQGGESIDALFRLAADRSLPIDMHCDETDDPNSRHVETMAACTVRYGLQGRVTGSHLTSMHSMDNAYADKLIGLLAESGLAAVSNPLINMTLSGRYDTYPKRRGLARIPELLRAGVPVGLGHDCVMDPWYRLGSHDMLEVASMGLHAAQMTSESEMTACFSSVTDMAAGILGLPSYGLAVGNPADLVVLQACSVLDALRLRPARLFVLRNGRIISRTAPRLSHLTLSGERTVDLARI